MLTGSLGGSTTPTPLGVANHNRPSESQAAAGVKPIGVAWLLTPSELSNMVLFTERVGSATHAAHSVELIRANPHDINNQREPSLSASIQ